MGWTISDPSIPAEFMFMINSDVDALDARLGRGSCPSAYGYFVDSMGSAQT